MNYLINLTQKILAKHMDPNTKTPELILLGYCSNETASEHISRYYFASKLVHGTILDIASGTCYGSSILKRSSNVNIVVSVDLDKDALRYGKKVYNADVICADATHLPFRNHVFDSVVSFETLEHIGNQTVFLKNIKYSLKKGGKLILSTPNKLYTSPFLQRPLNPYHIKEFYLSQLLNFLKEHEFKVNYVYGGKRVKKLELLRRISASLLKFCLSRLYLKPYLLDNLYQKLTKNAITPKETLLDPNPRLFTPENLKSSSSNIILYEYFLIDAHL